MVVIGICVVGFLLGLSMVTQGGLYMFTLIDSTAFSWNLLLFALLEVVLVAWIYGIDPFFKNLEEMSISLWGPIRCRARTFDLSFIFCLQELCSPTFFRRSKDLAG